MRMATGAAATLLVGLLSAVAIATESAPVAGSDVGQRSGDAASLEARLDALKSELPEAASDKRRFDRLLQTVAAEIQELGVETPSVSAVHDDALAAALRLVADVNFYAPGSQTVAHEALFAELDRRGDVTAVDVNHLHRTLVADRRWDDARDLAARFPSADVQALPERIDPGPASSSGLAVWRVGESGTAVSRHPVVWPEGSALLMVSHPGCGFSRRLLGALEAEEDLDAALPAFRLFLAPTFGTFDFRRVHAWNQQHAQAPHVLVDRPAQWEAWVPSWETPQLIFLVDGVVKERVVGWPVEGRRAEILDAVARLRAPVPSRGHDDASEGGP